MPRPRREDYPGAWHHVTNRGLARRLVFESPREMRAFLALVAREVRRKTVEVHAFCLMGTHFHLLVKSPAGRLSAAMQQIENRYVRWFNRRHRRDGPLFRGRFCSRLVTCDAYRHILVRYVDANPVRARVARNAASYPFGSARAWHTGDLPAWLATEWIGAEIAPFCRPGERPSAGYDRVFGIPPSGEQSQWVELVQRRPSEAGDDVSIFFSDSPARVRAWMLRKAHLADGTRPGVPVIGTASARGALADVAPRLAEISIGAERAQLRASDLVLAMMLRDLCGLRLRDVARETGVTVSTAHRRYELHCAAVRSHGAYVELATEAARRAVRRFLAQ